jgi:DNA primase small subunit
MFKWISYGKLNARENLALKSIDEGVESDYFHKREFSFTLENDVYCRYLCFKTAEQFKATLVDRLPFKIDIGAVFNI